MTTPTPRTDAFADSCMTQTILIGKKREGEKANLAEVEWINAVELARQLERDLAAAQEANNAFSEKLDQLDKGWAVQHAFQRIQRLQHRLAQSESDNFSLAAGQCIVTNGGLMGDDHGHLYCDMQRQRDELRGKMRVMADIMNTALDVMKTVEGDGSDEDEALMHIRAKMASAIDSVRRADKSAIDAAIAGEPS